MIISGEDSPTVGVFRPEAEPRAGLYPHDEFHTAERKAQLVAGGEKLTLLMELPDQIGVDAAVAVRLCWRCSRVLLRIPVTDRSPAVRLWRVGDCR